jgi:hypothetical protein
MSDYEPRIVSRAEFDRACDALWTEFEYQNTLERRTEDEAKDVPGFTSLGRRYIRHCENHWADYPGLENPGSPSPLDDLRKLAAIFLRGMIYCGIRRR